MKHSFLFFALSALLVLASCSGSKKSTTTIGFSERKAKAYLLLPFESRTRSSVSISDFQDSMRHRLITEFRQRDFKILDIFQFETVLSKQNITLSYLTDEQVAEACRILGADAVISCIISDTMIRGAISQRYKLRTNVKVTDIETQAIVYSTNKSRDFSSVSGLELEEYAKELARSIAIGYEEGRT